MNAAWVTVVVCLCGGVGSCLRYVVDAEVGVRWRRRFPLATLIINVAAGLCAGAVVAWAAAGLLPEPYRLVFAVGLLGGFSTFSTAVNEAVSLLRQLRLALATVYLCAQIVLPVLACTTGYLLAS